MLLTSRGILIQSCLLIVISLTNCEHYESDYAVDDDGDHAEISDEPSSPDYSKYYSVDTSAPLLAADGGDGQTANIGFAQPFEFPSFFSPSSLEFGASNKQEATIQIKDPFKEDKEERVLGFVNVKEEFPLFHSAASHMKDYFEESQKKQKLKDQADDSSDDSSDDTSGYASKPGPSYVSHKLPVSNYGEETGYSTPVVQKKKVDRSHNYNDESKTSASDVDSYKVPDYSNYQFPSPAPGKYADYNVGKSSSTVSQYPQATGNQETVTQSSSDTPYQKYSFQPTSDDGAVKSKFLSSLLSTVAPYNPTYNKVTSTENTPALDYQGSENIPKHLQGKGCVRVKKHIDYANTNFGGKVKRDAMTCYVCEDPKTSSKYTKCSYENEPSESKHYKLENYYVEPSEPESYRKKRYSGEEEYAGSDPYEYIKSRSQNEYPKQGSDNYNEEYSYTPDDFYSVHDKSASELQSEKIAKNPANCVKETKNGMTCTICKDATGGGNFEQCSYTSDPKEEKYAYVTEKKYNSNDEPAGSEQKPVVDKSSSSESKSPKSSTAKSSSESSESKKEPIKEVNGGSSSFEYPHHFAESSSAPSEKNAKAPSKKVDTGSSYEYPHHYAESSSNKKSAKIPSKKVDEVSSYEYPHHYSESASTKKNAKVPSKKVDTGSSYEYPNQFAESASNKKTSKTSKQKIDEEVSPYEYPHYYAQSASNKKSTKAPGKKAEKGSSYEYPHYFAESSSNEKKTKKPKSKSDSPYHYPYHYHADESKSKEKKTKKTDPSDLEDDHSFEYPYHFSAESLSNNQKAKPVKNLDDENPYEIPQHFAESTANEQKSGVIGLEPSLYGSPDSAESTETTNKSPYASDIHDEYHFNLFPDYNKEESQQTETQQAIADQSSKKDVAEVLAEFTKKDRTACKKAEKNGMTCYLCVDEKGIQHEECMYVSESKPQASHVAYHELQQIKSPKLTPITPTVQIAPLVAESVQQALFQKVTTPVTPVGLVAAASEEKETRIKYNPKKPKKNRRKKSKKSSKSSKKPREQKSSASEASEVDTDSERMSEDGEPPVKFVIGDEDGLYSAETKPTYSKTLGVKLPRYMIEKSEFEKEFDEFAGDH